MKNEFCTEKQSLALKELGYDEPCLGYYENGVFIFWYDSKQDNELLLNCTAPLRQQAFKFFREKYDLQYWLNDGGILGKCFIKITGYKHDKFYFSSSEPMEYEEAEESCLDKLIEIVKRK